MLGKNLIITCFATIGYVIGNAYTINKKPIVTAILFFFTMWSILFACDKCSGLIDDDANLKYDVENFLDYVRDSKKSLTPCQKDLYAKLSRDCFFNGIMSLKDAQLQSLLIPDDDLKSMTQTAIAASITAIYGGSFKAITVSTLITFISTYLVGVYDNFQKIELLLLKSQVYFEMSDFYNDIIRCDGNILNCMRD